MSADLWKQQAAERALAYLEDGMLLGLGTGSTAAKFVDLVGQRVKEGLKVTCVPTSEATRAQAERLGIALTTLDDVPFLDLTVDGADELDADLRLIKGGGGALLREKIVAMASRAHGRHRRCLQVRRRARQVSAACRGGPLRAGRHAHPDRGGGRRRRLHRRDQASPRQGRHSRFVTDSGNVILDCAFRRIDNPEALDQALKRVPGVVENGLFLGIADAAIIAGPDGIVVVRARRCRKER